MEKMRSSPRQLAGLSGLLFLCLGLALSLPVAGFVFDSPKPLSELSVWIICIFAALCGAAGFAIPYGAVDYEFLNKSAWRCILMSLMAGASAFVAASCLGAAICRGVHSVTLDLPTELEKVVFITVPLSTLITVLCVARRQRKKPKAGSL